MQYKQNPPSCYSHRKISQSFYKLRARGSWIWIFPFLDPLVEIKLSREDSSYSFLQGLSSNPVSKVRHGIGWKIPCGKNQPLWHSHWVKPHSWSEFPYLSKSTQASAWITAHRERQAAKTQRLHSTQRNPVCSFFLDSSFSFPVSQRCLQFLFVF